MTEPPPTAPASSARPALPSWLEKLGRGWILPAALLLYLAALLGHVHFNSPGLVERDGYYHARFAQLLPEFGLSREFRWTQCSTWKESFYDKEFIFHATMAPFCTNPKEPLGGAHTYVWLLNLGLFALLFFLLRKHQVPAPLLFTALLACMGGMFLDRLVMIRSHNLSLLLALAGMHYLVQKNWKALGILGFVYSWSYTFPFALVLIAGPFVAGRWFGGGELDWRSLAASLGGVFLGLAIHPYTPHTLEGILTILQILVIGAQGGGAEIELGMEIQSLSSRAMLLAYPLMLLLLATLLFAGWRIGKKVTPAAMGALTAGLAWFGASLFYARFMGEYTPVLLVFAAGLVARDAMQGIDPREQWLRPHRGATMAIGFGVVLLMATAHIYSLDFFLAKAKHTDPARFRGAAAWMTHNLEPGETVVNLWWDDFPELYYHGHRQNYLVGLDPTFMVRYDAEKAQLLEDMRTGRRPLDGPLLARTFNARYMVLRKRVAYNYPALTAGNWGYVHDDEHAVIYALDGPTGPQPPRPAPATDGAR